MILELQIHIVSFAILLIIYIQLRDEVQIFSMRDKLFKYLILSVMFPLCLEAMTYIISGSSGQIMRGIHVGLQVLRFGSVPLPLLIWAFYITLTVECQEKYFKKSFIPVGILLIINTLIALSSPVTKQYFLVDANNIYYRGTGHWISIIIVIISFSYSLFIFITNWKKVNQRNRGPMLLFFVPPTIGMVFQGMFSSTSLIWPACAISILIIYTMIQSQIVKIDYLTGLYNRRQLDFYLNKRIQQLAEKEIFGGIMIDLDEFKEINDRYGHAVGDVALRNIAAIMTKSFAKDAFIARYGGDEFTILLNIKDEKSLYNQIEILKNQVELFNKKSKEAYSLKISVGYSVYTKDYNKETNFLDHLDHLMYENKKDRRIKRTYEEVM